MGAGASSAAAEDVYLDEEVDERAWLTLHFVTDNGVRFNSVRLTEFVLCAVLCGFGWRDFSECHDASIRKTMTILSSIIIILMNNNPSQYEHCI